MTEQKKSNGNGHKGEDPQPQHGKDSKGHQEQKGGIITKPGVNHSLTLFQCTKKT